jgi:hypothetical protein
MSYEKSSSGTARHGQTVSRGLLRINTHACVKIPNPETLGLFEKAQKGQEIRGRVRGTVIA